MRDLHQALKSEIIAKERSQNGDVILAKLQWGKDDSALSVHVAPNTFTISGGIQTTDFLSYLGFQHSGCGFVESRQCYAREVSSSFQLKDFVTAFDSAFSSLKVAQDRLNKCGFRFRAPEGLSYFGYSGHHDYAESYYGDGHTSAVSAKVLKNSESLSFNFVFTWIENEHKGWTIHYRPKHFPLSPEIEGVFKFLELNEFPQCPEFDFETCYWKFIAHQSRENDFFDGNANYAHGLFDAHAEHFSIGLENLLNSNGAMERFQMGFLKFKDPSARLETEIRKRVIRPDSKPTATDYEFDVAVSFASTERKYAEDLASRLRRAGYSVFYDDFYPESLWGKDLVMTFNEIYSKRSRYCVIFVSEEYNNGEWTIHERSSAQARALKEKGKEYILPIKVDDVELPGMPSTIGYVSLKKGIEQIAGLLVKKLSK